MAALRRSHASAPPLYDPTLRPFGGHYGAPPEPEATPVVTEVPSQARLVVWVVLASVLAAALSLAAFQFLGGGGSNNSAAPVSLGGTNAASADSAAGGTNLSLSGAALDVQAVLAKVRESVVTIDTDQTTTVGIFGGTGSGVIISADGLVLTNEHVIRGADTIEVTLFNGLTFDATVMGSSVRDDIALIQVQGVTDTLPADLGSVETLRVGDEVLAIGNALGFGGEPTVTRGIVSAKNRELAEQGLDSQSLIQTDAAINPGNSGGPLVNAAGEVVGINTAIIEGAQNIGFAISIDSVRPLIDRLVGGDSELTPQMAFFGASSVQMAQVTPEQRAQSGTTAESGAFIVDVIAGSSADSAGLQFGDVIVSVDGVAVSSPEEVARAVRRLDPGQQMSLEFERAGTVQDLDLVLGERPVGGG